MWDTSIGAVEQEDSRVPKTLQVVIGYTAKLDGKTLLLKIPYSWFTKYREIMIELNWRLPSYWLSLYCDLNEIEDALIFSGIWIIGSQFMALFGQAWEVWPCWRKYDTRGGFWELKDFKCAILVYFPFLCFLLVPFPSCVFSCHVWSLLPCFSAMMVIDYYPSRTVSQINTFFALVMDGVVSQQYKIN